MSYTLSCSISKPESPSMEFFSSRQEKSFASPCSRDIAHTQQGAVTEHSPALQQKARKEQTILLQQMLQRIQAAL